MHNPEKLFVFNTLAVGEFGEVCSVAYAIVDKSGATLDEGQYTCPVENAEGAVIERVALRNQHPDRQVNCVNPRQVRDKFWEKYTQWWDITTIVLTRSLWPAGSLFLLDCVKDAFEVRKFDHPYPVHDLGTIMMTLNKKRTFNIERLSTEFPLKDLLAETRYAARLTRYLFNERDSNVQHEETTPCNLGSDCSG